MSVVSSESKFVTCRLLSTVAPAALLFSVWGCGPRVEYRQYTLPALHVSSQIQAGKRIFVIHTRNHRYIRSIIVYDVKKGSAMWAVYGRGKKLNPLRFTYGQRFGNRRAITMAPPKKLQKGRKYEIWVRDEYGTQVHPFVQ